MLNDAKKIFIYSLVLFISACSGVVDVAFIVDSSDSVEGNFNTLKEFVVEFIAGLDVGVDKAHIAYMTFSDRAVLQFPLNASYNAGFLTLFVERPVHEGGQTYINEALKLANTHVFNVNKGWRQNVRSVSINK